MTSQLRLRFDSVARSRVVCFRCKRQLSEDARRRLGEHAGDSQMVCADCFNEMK